MRNAIILVAVLVFGLSLSAQTEDSLKVAPKAGDEYVLGLFPKAAPKAIRQIAVRGWYRFLGSYTQMDQPYLLNAAAGQSTPDRSIFIGDDSQLPNMTLNIAGRPSRDMSFDMDLYMFQFLDANLGPSYGTQVVDSLRPPVFNPRAGARLGGTLGALLGINLTGSYDSPYGSFTARMGGIHWYYLSDLTFASFRGFNRFTLFERNPWDPVQSKVMDRYSQFYDEGLPEQDLRWGNRAFHGLIIDGASLPGDMSFSFMYGKTELNGGFNPLPNSSIGGRLRHKSKTGFQSLNTFNSHTFIDSLATASIGFNIHTLEIKEDLGPAVLHTEMGAGRYYAPGYEGGWGEAINAKLTTKKRILGFPLEVQYYRLSNEVINNNAIFWNTSIQEVSNNDIPAGAVGSNAALIPSASSIVPIGLMTNNRTGINLNADIEVDDLHLSVGYGVANELEGVSNTITYSHFVNQLTRSRFWRFNFLQGVGPYNRYDVVFRDAFETVQLTDDEFGTEITAKHFNNLEVMAKYKMALFGAETYLLYLGRFATVSPQREWILPTDERAYIRQYTHEFESYVALSPGLIWASYAGYERILGNYDTDVDLDSARPRNQMGFGVGTGFDVDLGRNAVLVLRHRYFDFEDRSFVDDKASGHESMAEIKVFF